jgi:hypothetical protein
VCISDMAWPAVMSNLKYFNIIKVSIQPKLHVEHVDGPPWYAMVSKMEEGKLTGKECPAQKGGCLVPIRIWCLVWKSSRSFLKSLHKSDHNVWCTSFQEPSIESQRHVTSPFSCLHVRVASHFVYLSWRTDFSIVCFSKWSMSRTAWAPAR